jgi:hypothetical protein
MHATELPGFLQKTDISHPEIIESSTHENWRHFGAHQL